MANIGRNGDSVGGVVIAVYLLTRDNRVAVLVEIDAPIHFQVSTTLGMVRPVLVARDALARIAVRHQDPLAVVVSRGRTRRVRVLAGRVVVERVLDAI